MSKAFQISLVFKGIFVALVCALILSLIFGIVITLTTVTESAIALNTIFGISVFIGGAIAAYQGGKKGLFYGLATGLGFILLLLLIYTVFNPESPSWIRMGEKAIIALVSGSIGGIIGVIFKR